jgi:hypothetical protein
MDRLEQQARLMLAGEVGCDVAELTMLDACTIDEAVSVLVKALSTRPDVGGLVDRPELDGLIERAKVLIECLLDNDPDETISDGGHVVLDLWRDDARKWLTKADALSSIPASGDVVRNIRDVSGNIERLLDSVENLETTQSTTNANAMFVDTRDIFDLKGKAAEVRAALAALPHQAQEGGE